MWRVSAISASVNKLNSQRKIQNVQKPFLKDTLGLFIFRSDASSQFIHVDARAGHFRYFLIFSIIKNGFFAFLSS